MEYQLGIDKMMIVIDLENTITNSNHRTWLLKYFGCSELAESEYKKEFQEGFVDDTLNVNVKLFIDSLVKKGYTIVILTAKLESYRGMVVEWLSKYKVKFDVLIMKQFSSTSDLDFKREYIKLNKDNITFALDDVGENCALFSEYNVPCLRIEQK